MQLINDSLLDNFSGQVFPWINGYPAGSVVELHSHDELQILYANSGSMHVETEGQFCIVTPFRAVIIPPGVEHKISINRQVEMATLYIGDLKYSPLLDGVRSFIVSPIIKQLILTVLDRSAEPSFNFGRNVFLLGLLFEEMQNNAFHVSSISVPQDRRAMLICEKVLSDPVEHLSLEVLAYQVGASSRTISRIFRRELDLSFCEWRQQVLVNFAINALHEGCSVSNIAFDLGYSSVSAFSFAFRKQVGCSPSTYVKKLDQLL